MFKTIGDLVNETSSPQSDESLETEILVGLEDCQRSIRDLEGKLAALKSQHVSRMSPQSRAANEVLGHDLHKQLNGVREASLQWQHRRNDLAKSQSRSTLRKSVGEVSPELRAMREHARAVNSGELVVTPEVRRRLVATLGRAELEFAESCR